MYLSVDDITSEVDRPHKKLFHVAYKLSRWVLNTQYGDTYAKVFAAVDDTGKGTISRGQLMQAVRLLGYNPTDEQLQTWLASYIHLEKFNYEQFVSFVVEEIRVPSVIERTENFRGAMAVIDRTNSGVIERQKLFDLLTKCGDMRLSSQDAVSLLEKLDLRKDGKIHLTELEKLFTSEVNLDDVLQHQQWDMV